MFCVCNGNTKLNCLWKYYIEVVILLFEVEYDIFVKDRILESEWGMEELWFEVCEKNNQV